MIQFKDKDLERRLALRGNSAHQVAKRWCERYSWLIQQASLPLTIAELNLVCDACNGWAHTEEPPDLVAQALYLRVKDAIEINGLDKKWEPHRGKQRFDVEMILAELKNAAHPVNCTDRINAFKILDYVEQFWNRQDEG